MCGTRRSVARKALSCVKSGRPLVWLRSWRRVTGPHAAGRVGSRWRDGVVEREHALVDERERDRAAERLGGAGHAHVVGAADRRPRAAVADAGAVHRALRPPLHDRDRPRRPARHGDEPVERPVELLGRAGGGAGRAGARQQGDEREQDGAEHRTTLAGRERHQQREWSPRWAAPRGPSGGAPRPPRRPGGARPRGSRARAAWRSKGPSRRARGAGSRRTSPAG